MTAQQKPLMASSSTESGKRRPDLSDREAVRTQIESLLTAVENFLFLSLDHQSVIADDPQCREAIHQLRIYSRRSQAALSVYEHLLPKKQHQWVMRQLRKIRRAAGTCRDLDVLRERLLKHQSKNQEGGKKGQQLLIRLSKRRRQSTKPLALLRDKLIVTGKFAVHKADLLANLGPHEVDENSANSFEQWSRKRLRLISRRFLHAGRLPLKTLPKIHRFRIRTKQLRYSLEILAEHLPEEPLAEMNSTVVKLQKLLGDLNDHAFAGEQIRQLKKSSDRRWGKQLKNQLRLAEQQLADSRRRLHQTWDAACLRKTKHLLREITSNASNESNPPFAQE
jgi:CHAD domain-containing protein